MKFHLYEDIVKIIKQLLGKSNMFGYKTTTANQLYMWYCFMGKIYTIDELHRHTKLLWFYFHSAGIIFVITTLTLYLLYGINEGFLMFLYVLFVVFVVSFTNIVLPLLAFVYRRRIESGIELVDKIVRKKSQTVDEIDNQINMNSIMMNIQLTFWVPLLLYSCVCHLDMALFYDESKSKNYVYYPIPLPNLEYYGSVKFYVFLNSILAMPAVTLYTIHLSMIMILMIMTITCHNEVQRIVHQMNSLSREAITLESYQVIEPRFQQTLVKSILDYRDAIRVVQHFRGFYEISASIILPTALVVEIVHANVFMSPEYPFAVKMRELSIFIVSILAVFYFCWIGEAFEEMKSTMSFAVYSTPWYWSTRMRKDVYLFLCEAQHSINATAWGVYPLLRRTFLRFMNTIQSSVNVLRATTVNR